MIGEQLWALGGREGRKEPAGGGGGCRSCPGYGWGRRLHAHGTHVYMAFYQHWGRGEQGASMGAPGDDRRATPERAWPAGHRPPAHLGPRTASSGSPHICTDRAAPLTLKEEMGTGRRLRSALVPDGGQHPRLPPRGQAPAGPARSLWEGALLCLHGLTSPVHRVRSQDGQTPCESSHQLRSVVSPKPARGAVTSAQSSLHALPPKQPLTVPRPSGSRVPALSGAKQCCRLGGPHTRNGRGRTAGREPRLGVSLGCSFAGAGRGHAAGTAPGAGRAGRATSGGPPPTAVGGEGPYKKGTGDTTTQMGRAPRGGTAAALLGLAQQRVHLLLGFERVPLRDGPAGVGQHV